MSHILKTVYCRTFQSVLKLGNYFMGYRMPLFPDGVHTAAQLGDFLRKEQINDVLLITGSGTIRRGDAAPLLDGLKAAAIRCTIQTYDHPDPTSDDVDLGFRAYLDNNCKAIIAMGGGSRIDCAKAIAARAAQPRKSIAQLQGLLKVRRPIPPLIAIPTTAGAGSETTVAAVITDSATRRKASINDPVLIPKYAVLDPQLTAGLPPFTTATTGMDALAHAVEAYTNRTYNTKLENRLAKEAVRLIHDNIETACSSGSDLTARKNMQLAAFYAGRSFTRGCVGYVHAIGHTLGGLYGVPHGLAMAVLLPHVMRQYGRAAHRRLSELADVCGISGADCAEKANNFIRWIEETNRKLGLPEGFDMIRNEDIVQIITWAGKEANPLYPVPVVWDREDFLKLIRKVQTS